MVQILPQEPGLGALLGGGVSQGISSQLQQMMQMKQLNEQRSYQQQQQQQLRSQQGQALGKILGFSPEESEILGSLPDTAIAQLIKTHASMISGKQDNAGLGASLDELDKMIPYTGSEHMGNLQSIVGMEGGKAGTWGGLNREAVQKREQFNTQGFWVTDQIYTHFNKGQISRWKLDQIKDKLAPRADLSERENRARIDSLRSISSLPRNADVKTVNKLIDRKMEEVSGMSETGLQIDQTFNKLPSNLPNKAKIEKNGKIYIWDAKKKKLIPENVWDAKEKN